MEIAPLAMRPVSMSAESHLGETIPKPEKKDFGTFLKDALSEVNTLQKESDRQTTLLAAGKVQDVSQVMVAAAKAEMALSLTLQIRNRAVNAYQTIMRMQV